MAGAGAKLFTSGSVLTADQVNTFLMDQSIMRFTSTTTRDAAFGGAGEPTLAEGMFAYTTDTNTLWLYNGSSWVNLLGSDIGEQALSNRNVIINGAMQVAQRGTSVASITTDGYYTADRFNTSVNTLGTWTQSVEADAPTGSGLRNSLKMLCTTADASPAASDRVWVNQLLEGQNLQQFLKGTSSAKPFSLSFWVKSNVTGTYIAHLWDLDNTRHVSASYTISASATWEKKTITFPADTTGAFDNNNDASLRVLFPLAAGSAWTSGTLDTTWATSVNANKFVGQTNLASAINNYWQITGLQVEAGAVATPFEFEDYGITFTKCQRYYCRVNGGYLGAGMAFSTTGNIINVKLPTTMRVAPSAIETTGTPANYAQVTSNTGTQLCNTGPSFGGAAGADTVAVSSGSASTGIVQGNATFILSVTGGAYLGFSAEL
ncbi:hypothetical protein UFOVP689_43 [uncultured Caudovirales phage]|uniref:Uncharacterized protein n=1 Tax=uncultured Caudovirales phage TaxID=2100421 RepID=A0A6J5NLA1_9CAUD|nr:hypothetical protein UFOVP689_43 [uncultured Caudovirales phage]